MTTATLPSDHPYVCGTAMTKAELVSTLAALGYKIDESSSFDYTNTLNPEVGYWKARACYVVEIDSGLGFANINARRDENFHKLQEFRFNVTPLVNGRVYQL